MPEMTGVEVLRQAKDLRPRAIRVFIDGLLRFERQYLSAINDGEIFRFINKPWSNVDLRSTIAAAVKASAVDYVKETVAPQEDLTARVHVPGIGRCWHIKY